MPTRRYFVLFLAVVFLLAPGCQRAVNEFTILFVPKLKGIPYFLACKKGAEEAAKELNIALVYDGPSQADAAAQLDLLNNAIASGQYGALLVACNDPDRLVPALKHARDKNMIVITYDADARDHRQFFVNQATYESVAHAMVDEMAEQLSPKGEGKVAILTSYVTAPNQAEWAKRMRSYAMEKYPKMQLLEETEHGEDRGKGIEKARSLITAHADLKGIIGLTSVAVPAAAEAVQQTGKKGQIVVTGVSTPRDMRKYVEDGTVTSFILWNPIDLGYLTVYVAHLMREGKMPENGTGTIQAGRLGEIQVRDYEVLLGPPMRFTKENVNSVDF